MTGSNSKPDLKALQEHTKYWNNYEQSFVVYFKKAMKSYGLIDVDETERDLGRERERRREKLT